MLDKLTAGVLHLPFQQKAGQIPSLSISARNWVTAKPTFTLAQERALSACHFDSLRLYFLFLATMSSSAIFACLSGIQSLCFIHSQPQLHALIFWGKRAHLPPRNVPAKWVMIEQDSFSISLYFVFLGKCYWLHLFKKSIILLFSLL